MKESRKISQIYKFSEEKLSKLFKEFGVFFAYSDSQFEENKTPLEDGDKYVRLFSGTYLPKQNVAAFLIAMEKHKQEKRDMIKAGNLESAEIAYELSNHECYYSGDIDNVVDLFDGIYTKDEILKVYIENCRNNND